MEVPQENGRFERTFAFQPTGIVRLPRPATWIHQKKSLESLEALRIPAMTYSPTQLPGQYHRR